MPRKSFRSIVELNIHAVTCPGTWLPHRQDLYLSVCLFGQHRRTQLAAPVFPLLFHDKFRFDKFFYSAVDPSQVVDAMEDYLVVIELIQLSDIYASGRCLASYECNARDFLFPYPSYTGSYGSQERMVLMDRTIDFPGIAPKLEFSTKTTINEFRGSIADTVLDDDLEVRGRSSARRSRSRQRSLSPSARRRLEECTLNDVDDEDRPPFVVRKVNKDLIHRTPGTPDPKSRRRRRSASTSFIRPRSRSLSPTRNVRVTTPDGYGAMLDDTYYDYTPRRQRISQILRETGVDPLPIYSDSYLSDTDLGLDSEYNLRKSLPYSSYRSYRPSSSYYDSYYDFSMNDLRRDLEDSLARSRRRRYWYYP